MRKVAQIIIGAALLFALYKFSPKPVIVKHTETRMLCGLSDNDLAACKLEQFETTEIIFVGHGR